MLDQSPYASKLLERSGMAECKLCMTPMEEWLKLTKASTTAKVDATLYWSIGGGLRYYRCFELPSTSKFLILRVWLGWYA